MLSAALTSLDLEWFQSAMEDPSFTSPSRLSLVRSTITSPPMPPDDVGTPDGSTAWCRSDPGMPDWALPIIAHREFFGTCALVVPGVFGVEYWKIVYCVQSPKPYLAVCKLELAAQESRSDQPLPTTAAEATFFSSSKTFKCNFGRMATAAEMPDGLTVDNIGVIFNIVHTGGTTVTSSFECHPVRMYLQGKENPREPKKKVVADASLDYEAYDKLVEQLPWVKVIDERHSFVALAALGASVQKKAATAEIEKVVIEMDDDEVLDVLREIDAARVMESEIAAVRGTSDFKTNECSGESNIYKGIAFHDAVQGVCCHKGADDWARGRRLQVTFKATFTEHQEGPSRILVRSWVHRMQFLQP